MRTYVGLLSTIAACGGAIDASTTSLQTPDDPGPVGSSSGNGGSSSSSGASSSDASVDARSAPGSCGTACGEIIAKPQWPTGVTVDDKDVVWGAAGWTIGAYEKATGKVRTIARAQGVASNVAMDATDIYWGVGEGAVFVCPHAGCPDPENPPALTRGVGAYWLAIDASNFYVAETSDGRVSWCPLGSGCPYPFEQTSKGIAVDSPSEVAVRDGTLYWTSARNGIVGSCIVSSCAATTMLIAKDLASPYAIVLEDDGMYWGEGGIIPGGIAKPIAGRLVHRKLDGSVTVVVDQRNIAAIATDASTVYWLQDDGWSYRCPKSGCNGAPTRIAYWLTAFPRGLAVDDEYIYWAEHNAPGAVVRAKKN